MRAALFAMNLVACGAGQSTDSSEPPPKPEATRKQWEEAWDLVSEFGEPKAEAGPWRVENAGAIIVSRTGPRPRAVPDHELLARVESTLAAAAADGSRKVSVSVREGVVQLHGGFKTRQDAGSAIWALLPVRGVDQIVSYLTWPGSELKPPRPRLQVD